MLFRSTIRSKTDLKVKPSKVKRKNTKQYEENKKLFEQGLSFDEIVEKRNITKSTLYQSYASMKVKEGKKWVAKVKKAKGHLGSLLENTCETVIRVEKDQNDSMTSIVSPALTRNREFGKFIIEMDDHWIPSLRRYNETESSSEKKEIEKFRKQQF